jgi:hypothetical protein
MIPTRTAILATSIALGVFGAVACGDRDDDDPTPTPPTGTVSATPTPSPTSPSAASTPVTDITRVSVPRGGMVSGEWALVTGNKLTGGAEVWLMPGGTQPTGISPSGRYFVWEGDLFDAWTGDRIPLNEGERTSVVLASFAPDETHVYVETAGNLGRVFRLDGTEVARLPDGGSGRPSAAANASQLNVVWSPDSRAVAVTRLVGGESRVDVVIDEKLQPEMESRGMAGWSNAGLRLAVTGANAAIYDFDSGASQPLERGGGYPSWSGDDRYVAVSLDEGDVPGLSVFDAATGREVLRVYEASACFDIFWAGDLLLPGWERAVDVAGAKFVERPDTGQEPPLPRFRVENDIFRWEDSSGVYAEARVSGTWAASFSWTRRDVDNWPPVLMLGLGGKDACLGQREPILVTPPFTPDRIPVATPTPDK